MELRHLRYFVATAKALSFSRAAIFLNITQPALSRQIRDLEASVGCLLLRRGLNSRTELTQAGKQFLAGAEKLLAGADALRGMVAGMPERLALGHYGSVWLDFFTPALRRYAKRHPDLNLRLVEKTPAELRTALQEGEVDIAFLGARDTRPSRTFSFHKVAEVPARLLLPVRHPLAKKRKLRLRELAQEDWISWDEREYPGRNHLLLKACKEAGFQARVTARTDSIASMVVRVATSDSIGFALPMADQVPHQGVVFTEIIGPPSITFDMHVAFLSRHPRADIFAALVQELSNP